MLKKLLLISIIILSSAIVLQAQENERNWDEGKISWNDFSGAYCFMDTRLSWENPDFNTINLTLGICGFGNIIRLR